MRAKYLMGQSESIKESRFSEKMRVLKGKYTNSSKVRVDIRCLNYLKRELIEKVLHFNDKVSV